MYFRNVITLLLFFTICFVSKAKDDDDQKIKDLFESGMVKTHLKDFAGAIEDFTAVLRIDSEHNGALYRRAMAKYEMQDYFGSVIDLNRVLTKEDSHIKAILARAKCKSALLNYEGAIEDYDLVLGHEETNHVALLEKAKAEMAIEAYKESVQDFSLLIKLEPQNVDAYYLRGLIYIHLGEKENGCLDLSKAGELGDAKAYEKIKEFCVP